MANSLQERLKLKQYQVDTWTPKEQLCLASAVMRSGDQNWVAVSRTIKTLTTETNRPSDWYSTKNCALMYAKLLEKVDTPKRKRERGEPTSTNIETPGEIVTKMLAKQRIEELRVLEAQSRTSYNHLRQQIQHLEAGMLDHTLDAEWEAFVRERKEEEEKERLHREWLKQREEKIHAIQKALKHQIPKVPISSSSSGLHKKKVGDRPSWPSSSSSERRDSGMSDNSELDAALDSPSISSPMVEEPQQSETETKPVPTSPLLSSLLSKPPNPPSNSNVAADLRQSFNLSSSRGRVGLSPNVSSALQNLVSSAISGTDATHKDHQKNASTSPGSAAPTLSRLLELPPRPPGDPMPSITDLPPTHAETMAQVHKGSPPELKKAKLDIEVLAAEAAESFLSDSLLNDLDDQLDDEVMDEDDDDKKDDDLSSMTSSHAVPQEGGKIREQHSLEMRGTNLSSPLKLHGGKADPQKCSESSPETDADLPLEEDKKGDETEPQMSGGLGKSDVFPAVDSPMDDLEQTEDIKFMDEDSMDSTKNKNEKEDLSEINIKKSLGEERQEHIVKLEKTETNVMSLDISELLTKEGNEVTTKKSLKDDKELKENELEEILSKMDEEDKESPVVEKRGRKKKKVVDLEDEFLNDDSRDAMSEEEMVHARGGKRKSSGSDLFAVASPFVPESNPCSPASTLWGDENDAEKAYRAWKKPIMILWNEIAAHKFASVFLRPITDDQAPGYHDVIHRPMDLKSIKARIENGTITNTSEFQRDIMLMFLNATMYNTSDHNVYQMANRMMRDTVSAIEEFRTTQMLARASDTPIKSLRRGTRESSAKRGDDDPKMKGFETPEIKKRRL